MVFVSLKSEITEYFLATLFLCVPRLRCIWCVDDGKKEGRNNGKKKKEKEGESRIEKQKDRKRERLPA